MVAISQARRPVDARLESELSERGARLARCTSRLTDGDRQAERRVSTRGPRSVIATVCSKWADREPSAVTIVHRSGIVRVLGAPAFTIGSMAIVRPGVSFISRFGLP